MNRRKFSLSWGRKLFFGISWPLSCVLGLIYFKSILPPKDFSSWLYLIFNHLGHYGLLNVLAYFLLYCPVVLLLPTYYVSRFWSLILILGLNSLILIDGLTFATYHSHLYGFLSQLVREEGITLIFGSSGSFIVALASLVVFAILVWIRGEQIWRAMQRRFNNQVKNWYLIFIVVTFMLGHALMFFGRANSELSTLYPVNIYQRSTFGPESGLHGIHYPKEKLVCGGRANPNLVVISIREWSKDQLDPETMPNTTHLQTHAQTYSSHWGVSSTGEDGIFSLLYSIPATFKHGIGSVPAAIEGEASKRNYAVTKISSEGNGDPVQHDSKIIDSFRLLSPTFSEGKPFFVTLTFHQHASEVDKLINDLVLMLQKSGKLSETYLVLTGGFSGDVSKEVPLLVFTPDRSSQQIAHKTSHYDVMPTLMEKMWSCKNAFQASMGKSLKDEKRDWLLISGPQSFSVLDFQNQMMTKVSASSILDTPLAPGGKRDRKLLLKVLRKMKEFNRSR
jgi:membrane-anchored protein YejM (alkaline phosphatase superfamily)